MDKGRLGQLDLEVGGIEAGSAEDTAKAFDHFKSVKCCADKLTLRKGIWPAVVEARRSRQAAAMMARSICRISPHFSPKSMKSLGGTRLRSGWRQRECLEPGQSAVRDGHDRLEKGDELTGVEAALKVVFAAQPVQCRTTRPGYIAVLDVLYDHMAGTHA